MPLLTFTDTEAVFNRKNNPVAGWGERGDANRVEPIALPQFDVPFKFKPGERIFTVGSCFARNVESELLKRGFVVPVWDLFKRPEFANLNMGIINNYGTPSIYNEIAWAFGEEPFVPEQHLLEVRPGKFADIHLDPFLRPESWEAVLSRRQAISEAYRVAATCNVVVMTLGLAELWFDTVTDCYVNVAPRPSLIDRHPERFQLHVLTFQEAFDYLEKSILILRNRAPSLNVVLTVSPVPLMSTHRPVDVMVANTYSKSLLRCAAEAVVTKYPFVTYFPSYESVVLSDRGMAWVDDMVHVTPALVALNVGRMIEAFVDVDEESETFTDELSALEKAKTARARGPEYADAFFRRHAEWSQKNRHFAIEHARQLLAANKPQAAIDLLSKHGASQVNIAVPMAQAMTAINRGQEALDLLEPFVQKFGKSVPLWEALVSASLVAGDPDKVNSLVWRYKAAVTGRVAPAMLKAAKWFHDQDNDFRAVSLAKAVLEEPLMNSTAFELSEFFIELGKLPLARKALAIVASPTGFELVRQEQLQMFLGWNPGAAEA